MGGVIELIRALGAQAETLDLEWSLRTTIARGEWLDSPAVDIQT